VTRLGTLFTAAAPIVVWAAIGGSTGAADAHDAPVAHGARAYATTARSTSHTRANASRGRHKTSGCSTARAKRSASCHTTTRRSSLHTPPATRVRPASTKALSASGQANAVQAATLAKVLATPCQNTQLTPEAGNLTAVRAAVLCLINTERAQNGKEPLSPDPRLEQAAESHGKEMLSVDYFDHVSPSGLTPVQRIRETGYIPSSEVGYVIGENLAWGTLTLATPQAIVSAWIASPEHLANILEGKYRETGIDVEPEVPQALAEGVAGALYTQEFGVIVH
jgi:uncharacterized protein YkwD